MRYTVIKREHKDLILSLAPDMGVADIRKTTGLSHFAIYRVLRSARFDIKAAARKRQHLAKGQQNTDRQAVIAARVAAIPRGLRIHSPQKSPS